MSKPTDGTGVVDASVATTTIALEPELPAGALAAIEQSEAAASRRGKGARTLARRFGALTSLLVLGVAAALGFVAGVRVQKTQQPATVTAALPGGAGGAGGFAALAGGGGGFPGAAGGGGAFPAGGAAAGRQAGAGGAAATGTVKLVDGPNIYVADATGNVVKVATSDAARFTKSGPGTIADVRPGDTVVVQGQKGEDGTVAATAVTNTAAAAR